MPLIGSKLGVLGLSEGSTHYDYDLAAMPTGKPRSSLQQAIDGEIGLPSTLPDHRRRSRAASFFDSQQGYQAGGQGYANQPPQYQQSPPPGYQQPVQNWSPPPPSGPPQPPGPPQGGQGGLPWAGPGEKERIPTVESWQKAGHGPPPYQPHHPPPQHHPPAPHPPPPPPPEQLRGREGGPDDPDLDDDERPPHPKPDNKIPMTGPIIAAIVTPLTLLAMGGIGAYFIFADDSPQLDLGGDSEEEFVDSDFASSSQKSSF
eukprot:TRINITY_DN1869_c3_g1_i1.p1 TRINITY_DN1869_c3_g1~~TRINITY_DN1869_c3_g1_i1.p1  ORF type:complete len:259 (+),score=56.22 TRINITY_DN1869_c3_g1_i1:92-868(+)